MNTIKIGDKVGYSRRWLRSTGTYTGPIPMARGIVTELNGMIAVVDWNNPEIPTKVHVSNLAQIGSVAYCD